MIKGKLRDMKIIRIIIIYSVLFLVMTFGVIFYTKYLPKNSFGADNEKMFLQTDIEKYINFKISDEDKGTLLQYNVKTWVESQTDKEEQIPLKQSQIKLVLNQIDGKYPYDIRLIPIRTEATNGKIENIKGDYRYSPETGNLIINTSNLDENGELICTEKLKDAKDEYTVICYYDTYIEEAIEREIDIKAIAVGVLSSDNSLISSQEELKKTVKEKIGDIISVENTVSEIYNGNIKSNIINKTDYSTQYSETQKIVVSKKEEQNRIYISEDNEFINILKNGNEEDIITDLGNNNELVYKKTIINKQSILKIFGENGKIEILDNDKNVLTTIDANTEADEKGNVVVDYLKDIKSIIIKTSEIKNEGILKIENTKEIKSTMKNILNTKIKTSVKLFDIDEKTNTENNDKIEGTNINQEKVDNVEQILIFKNEKENIIDIQDSVTNIDFNIDKTELTNKEQNDVIFDIYLNSNNIKDNMFNNPNIEIELPEEVEKVILGESFIVYGNGLELKDINVKEKENGKFSINANIEGEQTEYINNSLDLKTNIHIPATIILKKDINNVTNSINLVCQNYYTVDGKAEIINKNYDIELKNYKDEDVKETKDEDIYQQEHNSNITSSVKAEVDKQVEGLKLEVTPVKGDTVLKDGDTVYEGEFIKYNIKVTNTSDKAIENIKVVGTIPDGTVYGELEADYHTSRVMYEEKNNKKLEDELYKYNYDENIKEKVIELKELPVAETKEIFYEVRVNDLKENEEKETFAKIEVSVEDSVESSYQINNIIKHAEAKVYVSAHIDNQKNDWCYIVKIEAPDEVTLNFKLPKEYEFDGIVNSNQETNISEDNIVTVRLDSGEYIFKGKIDCKKIEKQTEESKLELKAYATIEYNNQTYKSNENRILYEYENVLIEMTSEHEGEEIEYKGEINYQIKIKNIGSTNITDVTSVKLTDYLPREIKPIKITYENYEKEILGYDEEKKEYILSDEYKKVEKDIDTSSRYADTTIPDIDLYLNIPEKETLIVNINAIADIVMEKTKIENRATVTGDFIKTKTSNTVSHILLPLDYSRTTPQNPDNPENPEKPTDSDNTDDSKENNQKYSISGVAWFDINQDGQRQSSEELLEGIDVMLVDADNATSIQDKKNTDSNGIYNFENLKKGKYIIVFRYDTNKYSLTDYKKEGVNLSINSDAMNEEITISGKKEKVGLTEILSVDGSLKNIDVGLVKNKVCDLKLDKYISKVTVLTSSGTKEQFYDNSNLAKVEIKSKEIQGAKVLVEYKLVVTNEGEIPTNVNKVIDYIPEGLEFSSELNDNWNIIKTGEVTNESLSNTKIEPGKKMELTLVLTKTMTNDSTGTYTNSAEIGEISNTLKIKDTDSTPGNRIQTEDDYSKADLIISVSTGALIYIYIVLIGLLIVGIFIYLNIKFGFKRINKITLLITFLCIGILGKANVTNASINKNDYYGPVYFSCNDSYPTYFIGYINGRQLTGTCGMDGGQFGGKFNRPYYLYSWSERTNNSSVQQSQGITLEKKNSSDDEIRINKISNNYVIGPFKISGNNDNKYSFNIYISGKTTPEEGIVCDSDGIEYENGLYTSTSTTTTFYLKLQENKLSQGQRIISIKCTASKKVNIQTQCIKTVVAYYRPGVLSWDSTTKYLGYTWPTWDGIKYQDVRVEMNIRDVESEDKNREKEIEWEIKYGDLEITKVDANDSDVVLSNVKIRVYCNDVNYDQTFFTDNNGKIKIKDLRQGTYTVEEISNTHYGYTAMATGNVRVNPGMNNLYNLKNNKKTGNIVIVKKDANSNKPLEGVTFQIKKEDGGYVKIKDNKNERVEKVTGQIHVEGNTIEYVQNQQNATEFVTNTDGRIELNNVLNGYYEIEEKDVGNNWGYELDNDYISWGCESVGNEEDNESGNGAKARIWVYARDSRNTKEQPMQEDRDDIVTFYNNKKYIKVSGYAWEDLYIGKTSSVDDLYESNDKKLSNIMVRLCKSDGTVIDSKYTDSNGEYEFGNDKKVLINDLKTGAYVEFEYNGMSYKAIYDKTKTNEPNSSKATENLSKNVRNEVSKTRNDFNNNYATIEYNKSNAKTLTYIQNTNNKISSKLVYGEDNNIKYGYNNQEFPISGVFDQYIMTANTYDADSSKLLGQNKKLEDILKEGKDTIENVNLGLRKREHPDLELSEDVDNVKIALNGYEYTYNRYGSKSEEISAAKQEKEREQRDKYQDPEEYERLRESFNVEVNFGSKYGPESYSRRVYSADVGCNETNKNLDIYVTYKLTLRNASTNLYSKINSIANYYDKRYIVQEVYYKNSEQKIQIEYSNDSEYNQNNNNGFNKVNINSELLVESEKEKDIYITYKLNNDAIQSTLHDKDEENQQDKLLNSVSEITSYSSYTKYSENEKVVYGGIDRDSNPGSAIANDKNTYEDDTDFAPAFRLNVEEGRVIKGNVWEDNSTVDSNKERKGDGIYDKETENRVGNVKVELLEAKEGEYTKAKLYKKDGTEIEAETNTSNDGSYELSGVTPGQYLIRYTYGNESVIYDINGNKKYDVNALSYKSTIYRGGNKEDSDLYWYGDETGENATRLSDAKDEDKVVEERTKISNEIINYQKAVEGSDFKSIKADTRKFEIDMEYDLEKISKADEELKFVFDNIDLGIVKRPKQVAELVKKITWVEVTLANGQTIISGNPQEGEIKSVQPLGDGNVWIQLDNELIQSATLKVRYTISLDSTETETDYLDKDYYIYGINPNNNDLLRKVQIQKVYDYVDNSFKFNLDDIQNSGWHVAEINPAQKGVDFSEEAYEVIKNYNTVLETDVFNNINPNDTNIPTITIELSKLLANSDDISLDNDVEINQLKGSKLDNSIPGNYVPGKSGQTSEPDSDNAYLSITTPTGKTDNTKQIIIMSISFLVILGTGIIFLKKKIIK